MLFIMSDSCGVKRLNTFLREQWTCLFLTVRKPTGCLLALFSEEDRNKRWQFIPFFYTFFFYGAYYSLPESLIISEGIRQQRGDQELIQKKVQMLDLILTRT